jgi:hypothetical protein
MEHLSPNIINPMIHQTLLESADNLIRRLDKLGQLQSVNDSTLEEIIADTHRFTVFLKHSGDYLRRTNAEVSTREEMVRLKLHLLSVLRTLMEAIRANDHLAAQDLLTEELRDNLTLWKTQILPRLRPTREFRSR